MRDDIIGIELPALPFSLEAFIGDLFYHDFPVTSVYEADGQPIILEWVDSSEDSAVDRYIVYKIDRLTLKEFLTNRISHFEMIKSAISGSVILFDRDLNDDVINISVLSPLELPKEYLPKAGIEFEISESVDHLAIQNHFELSGVGRRTANEIEVIRAVSNQINSNVINLHMRSGNGIGFGKIDTGLLGESLVQFDKLYREVALDHMLGLQRGKIQKANEEQKLLVSTEVVVNHAASYSVFIRPITTQISLLNNNVASKPIIEKIERLIENAHDAEEVQKIYEIVSPFSIEEYKKFLVKIKKKEIDLDLSWFDPMDDTYFSKSFNLVYAHEVIQNIENVRNDQYHRFELIGKFSAINTGTAHFTFESNQGEHLSGYFDVLLRDNLVRLNFTKLYKVVINQSITKEAGKVGQKVANTIVSCLELSNEG